MSALGLPLPPGTHRSLLQRFPGALLLPRHHSLQGPALSSLLLLTQPTCSFPDLSGWPLSLILCVLVGLFLICLFYNIALTMVGLQEGDK